MILSVSSNFDNTDYDILTVEEWNSLIILLNKLRGCKLEVNKTIRIVSDE